MVEAGHPSKNAIMKPLESKLGRAVLNNSFSASSLVGIQRTKGLVYPRKCVRG